MIALGIANRLNKDNGFALSAAIARAYTGSLYIPNDANCFQDSAGTTPATKDSVVGLLIDQGRGGLGPELVANGGFDSDTVWAKGAGVTIAAGVATYSGAATNADLVTQNISVVSGRTYAVTYTVSSLSGGLSARIGSTNGAFYVTAGTRTEYIVAGATGSIAVGILGRGAGVTQAAIDNISVREVPGIHATQATTGYKPILRKGTVTAGVSDGIGPWHVDFDDTDDRIALASVPLQMSDSGVIMISCLPTAAGTLFSAGNTADADSRMSVGINASGYATATWTADDGLTTATITGSTDLRGTDCVIEIAKATNDKSLWVNGVQVGATDSTAIGTTTFTTAKLGCLTSTADSDYASGRIYGFDCLKGTPTDSERAIMRRYLASLGGFSI